MDYCLRLPNSLSASWLGRISWGIAANQKQQNSLNEYYNGLSAK